MNSPIAGLAKWRGVSRAAFELALAKVRFGRHSARELLGGTVSVAGSFPTPPPPGLVETVRYLIPRVARRVVWRADCLIQAMAAQRWLGSAGIETVLHLGVRKSEAGELESHAWLTAGETVVTGWDIARFDQFREISLPGMAEP